MAASEEEKEALQELLRKNLGGFFQNWVTHQISGVPQDRPKVEEANWDGWLEKTAKKSTSDAG